MLGGDYAPASTVKGAVLAKAELPEDVDLVLLGDESQIVEAFKSHGENPDQFQIIHCPERVEMSDHPTRVLSQKPNSGIAIGFKMLKTKELDAFASCGNTGAMLVGSLITINSIPGIIRPCIISHIPKETGTDGIILDVGANADCKPDVLYQFAILGSIYSRYVSGLDNPRVGLLNIGEEEEKGNLLTQATHELMKGTSDFNFIGNIEGRDIFSDKCDVIVCDGFTGNVVLKEAEAFFEILKRRGYQDAYFSRFNYENYGGTPVLGVNGNVIIGHGISNDIAIKNMILHSVNLVNAGITEKIKLALNNE